MSTQHDHGALTPTCRSCGQPELVYRADLSCKCVWRRTPVKIALRPGVSLKSALEKALDEAQKIAKEAKEQA